MQGGAIKLWKSKTHFCRNIFNEQKLFTLQLGTEQCIYHRLTAKHTWDSCFFPIKYSQKKHIEQKLPNLATFSCLFCKPNIQQIQSVSYDESSFVREQAGQCFNCNWSNIDKAFPALYRTIKLIMQVTHTFKKGFNTKVFTTAEKSLVKILIVSRPKHIYFVNKRPRL